ncbi:MAG TPA: hypothetical protein PLN69_11790 [bacterium]|nr:hypothetical protein [bacterium]
MKKHEEKQRRIVISGRWQGIVTAGLIAACSLLLILFFRPHISGDLHRARFTQCVEKLHDVKIAIETHREKSGLLTADHSLLGSYMDSECGTPEQCGQAFEREAGRACEEVSISVDNDSNNYRVTGYPRDEYRCLITVTPTGISPESWRQCKKESGPTEKE